MNKKILIVEDDKNLAEGLKNLLISKKMDVKVTASSQQAEHLITLEKYDLLIVDLILPKMNGLDLIRKIISKGHIHSHCKIWVISGVLKKNVVSKDVLSHVDDFIEKPLNPRLIEKKVETLFIQPKNLLKNLNFFYMDLSDQLGNVLKNKDYIIKGHELMFICFYLYSIRFNGMLSVQYKNQRDEILFCEGKINSFKTDDKTSYLGVLLIKNNVVSKEEIQKLLKQDTDQLLGHRLVDDCYISPHQLDKILKEQLAIRLFKTMSQPSLIISCQDFTVSRQFSQMAELDIKNHLSLIHNWIHSKVTVKWLRGFFKSCSNLRLVPSKTVLPPDQLVRYSNMDYFSKPIQSPMSTADFLAHREESEGMCELYCRLLVREVVMENTLDENVTYNYEFMKKKYKTFLEDAHKKTYFELMNLPVNTSVQKIEEVYKNMVKIFHPDRRRQDMPQDLVEVCDQCFILIRKIYQTLTDTAKRQAYTKKIRERNVKNDFSIQEQYMKGCKHFKEGRYESAFSQFETILNERLAPGDTVLYYISSKLKNMKSTPSTKEQKKITYLFERVSLEHQQSALFYFSKALFKQVEGDKKSAFDLFTKAILLDPTLTSARVERHALNQARKKKSKPNSLLKLFKKGA